MPKGKTKTQTVEVVESVAKYSLEEIDNYLDAFVTHMERSLSKYDDEKCMTHFNDLNEMQAKMHNVILRLEPKIIECNAKMNKGFEKNKMMKNISDDTSDSENSDYSLSHEPSVIDSDSSEEEPVKPLKNKKKTEEVEKPTKDKTKTKTKEKEKEKDESDVSEEEPLPTKKAVKPTKEKKKVEVDEPVKKKDKIDEPIKDKKKSKEDEMVKDKKNKEDETVKDKKKSRK